MRPLTKQAALLVSISLVVGGCASTKEAVLPQDLSLIHISEPTRLC